MFIGDVFGGLRCCLLGGLSLFSLGPCGFCSIISREFVDVFEFVLRASSFDASLLWGRWWGLFAMFFVCVVLGGGGVSLNTSVGVCLRTWFGGLFA